MIRMRITLLLAAVLALSSCGSGQREELETRIADLESELASVQTKLAESQEKLEEAQTAMTEIASKSADLQAAVADVALVNAQLGSEDWQDVVPRLHTSVLQLDSAAEGLDSSVQQGVMSIE